jgi:hypothetical protein
VNEQNVDALELIIRSFFTSPFPTDYRFLAEQLARRGVLVPGAMTNADCLRVLQETRDWEKNWESLQRAALERIAKGAE